MIKCQWKECEEELSSNAQLNAHVDAVHVGASSTYECLWRVCPTFGAAQTSRQELEYHCNGHTNYQPYWCVVPECDEKFARPDSLVTHCSRAHNTEIEAVPGATKHSSVYMYQQVKNPETSTTTSTLTVTTTENNIDGSLEQLEKRLEWAKELEAELEAEYQAAASRFQSQVARREEVLDDLLKHELGSEAEPLCVGS